MEVDNKKEWRSAHRNYRYKKIQRRHIEGVPEILVSSTNSCSMTKDVFFQYVEHSVASLPKDHEPITYYS
jgi:hypothetical protein